MRHPVAIKFSMWPYVENVFSTPVLAANIRTGTQDAHAEHSKIPLLE